MKQSTEHSHACTTKFCNTFFLSQQPKYLLELVSISFEESLHNN